MSDVQIVDYYNNKKDTLPCYLFLKSIYFNIIIIYINKNRNLCKCFIVNDIRNHLHYDIAAVRFLFNEYFKLR